MTMIKMNIDKLANVSGGTVTEYNQLGEALIANRDRDAYVCFGTHMPVFNAGSALYVEMILEEKYGVKAHIDLGILGTGYHSHANQYKDIATGRSLSHLDVLSRISKG